MEFWNAGKNRQTERRLAAAIVCCSAFCSGTAFAAESAAGTGEPDYALEDTIVTAERIPSTALETPANVTVITAREIAENHYADLSEALSHVNGVIVSNGNSGSDQMVRLNGDERVVVLLDGERLNNDQGSMTRASINLNMLASMKNIERIEIVKGGASALYGSDAVGGVINIITKKVKENRTTIDLNTGSWGTHQYELTNEGSDHNVSWFLTAGLQKQGYFSYKVQGSDAAMPASDQNNNSLSLRLDAKLDDTDSLRFRVDHKSIDAGAYYNLASTGDRQKELFNNWSLTFNFKENTATPGYLRYYDHYKWEDFSGAFNTRARGIEYQNGWSLGKNNKLIAGAELRHSLSSNRASGYEDKVLINKALYLQDTINFAKKWSFVPGIRVDQHSMFGSHWTPKAALNYNPDARTQFYASWGRVYKAPTADDLYYTNAAYMMYGNERLQPESGYTESLGVQYQWDDKTSIKASVFQSEIHDAIYWLYNSSTWETHAQNVSLEKKRGLEISFQRKINPIWSYDLGYSYIHTEADYKNSTSITAKNQQPNGYKFGLHYANRGWKANLLGSLASGLDRRCYTTERYFLLDFNTSYAINPQTAVYFKINNLTNQEYQEYPGSAYACFPAKGRFFQVGVTYSF